MVTLATVPYERKHRNAVLSLRSYSRRTHSHLDWHQPQAWLDKYGHRVRLAYINRELMGFMAVSEALNHTAWIRLVALHDGAEAEAVLFALWQAAQDSFHEGRVNQVYILLTNNWLAPYLPDLGFAQCETVVTLFRQQTDLPLPPDIAVMIRQAYSDDLPAILDVDHRAFAPPWQMSRDEMYQSLRLASSVTVAELAGQIVGYQTSTRHHLRAHLARLAVLPAFQGRRIAASLLHRLIEFCDDRGVRSMTVNTQDTNIRSQNLYLRYGFQRNFFDLPVWMAEV